MNQPAATEISPQLKKVKRISAIVQVVLNIIIAFTGIGIAFGLIGMAMAGTLRLDIGNGDFGLHVYRGDETASSAQLLIVPHDEGDWDGAFYDQPRVEQAPASVPLTTTMRIVLGFIGLLNGAVTINLLTQLAKLFRLYENGEIFTRAVVQSIRNAGMALMGFPVMAIVNSIAASATTAILAPQLDFLTLEPKLNLVLAAMVLIMVSWIMDVGRQLQEESALTI